MEKRPLLRIALAVLGDADQELPATRALEGLLTPPFTQRNNTVYYGLQLLGCQNQSIMESARRAGEVSDDARGALCPSEHPVQ